MQYILSVNALRKRFGDFVAVDGVSFDVRPGICFGLLGPNGAGKTTSIEMIEGITPADSGEILFKGRPAGQAFREACGIQFQHTALPDFLTTREALALFAKFYRQPVPLAQLASDCHLDDYLDHYATRLSGGQRQRLLLALALINDPDIVFLDEPTTGLDPQARRNFWSLIQGLKARGKTIILTTHYMDEAELLCDDLAIMDRGRVIARGSPTELLRQHFQTMRVRLDRSVAGLLPTDWPEPLTWHDDAIEIASADVPATLQRLLAAQVPLSSLEVRPATLEDLFIALTGHALRQ